MHLKTLTVRGFKSFASATTFEFEPGVTAVVGPNGSGKSNVVDALSWVMGEQGAKSLRGGKMEDVIFAGTSGRPPLGRAHVSLTIDNADGALPIDYSEVTISRTLFRSGGSEYAINGSSCRLLDIQELLSDSGLGREMHVIVGQGQLDRILHATPEERRGFVEEAAGVLKHRRRKEKTVRKLASMQTNVSRLEDLAAEVGRQLTPLGRQAKVARRAQRIQHDVRDARARLFADDWIQASTALDTDLAELQELQDRLARAESGHEELSRRIAGLEADAARLTPEAGSARDTWYALSRQQERFASLAQLAEERARASASPVARAHLRDPQDLQRTVERLESETERAEQELERARSRHEQALERRSESERAATEEDEHHAALVAAAASRREDLAKLRGRMATAKSEHEAVLRRREEQREHLAGLRQRLEELRTDLQEKDGGHGPTEQDQRTASEASDAAHARTEATQAELDAAARDLNSARRAADAAQARAAALKDSMPAADATEAVLERFAESVQRIRDGIAVDPAWAGALATALGPLAEGLALVGGRGAAGDDEDPLGGADRERDRRAGDPGALAADILAEARSRELGVVSLLLTRPDGGTTGDGAPTKAVVPLEAPVVEANVLPAAEAVAGGSLAPAVRTLLSRTLLVPGSEEALLVRAALLESGEADWTIAAADGTLLTPSRMTGGSADAVSGLEVAARIEAARTEAAQADHALDLARAAHQKVSAAHQEARQAAEEARREFSRVSQESAARAASVARARALVESAEAEAAQAETRLEQYDAQEPESAAALKRAVAAVSAAVELQQNEGNEALENAEARRAAAREAAAAARAQETEALLAVRAAQTVLDSAGQRRDAAVRAVAAEKAAHAEADRQEARRLARHRSTCRIQEMVGAAETRLERSLVEADARHRDLQDRRAAVETRLAVARKEEQESRAALDELRRHAHSGELEQATRQARLESLQETILEELSLTTERLVEDYGPHLMVPVLDEAGEPDGEEPFVRDRQEKRLARAQRDLKALGRVNPLALEEFAALEERHTYLVEQLADLKKTKADLEEIIRDVDDHVRQVFAEAFRDTQEQFVQVFSTLFPGGEGKLVLTDPQDMLATGIDVHAKPAGKKVKRLSLLSGGERSLTAIAMLVAIFKARPSPFYVMDEVEAALDDRNLGRLLTILKELQQSSQLIVITHQKRTMEIADALYGVSMRGDGITQVISQRLADLA